MKVFVFVCSKCNCLSYTRGNKAKFKCRLCHSVLFGKDIINIPHFADKVDLKLYNKIKQEFRNELMVATK